VYTTPGPFVLQEFIKNTKQFSIQENGCGPILLIRLKPGVYHHSNGQSEASLVPTNVLTTIFSQKFVSQQFVHPQKFIFSLQIRIRIEHTIGVLKGRFQSLLGLRIQVLNHRRHLWAIMWIRCCIILHNLIIRIESGSVDEAWRREMYNEWLAIEGQQQAMRFDLDELDSSSGEEEGANADFRRARRAAMSEGDKFRRKVMNALFDSPTSGAIRRND
jgi:hypothetical protein